MQRLQNKSNRINLLLIILVISFSIEIPFENKISSDKTCIPQLKESSVYYKDTDGFARGVYVSGDYAYVADSHYGLAVFNISDPTSPGTPIYEDTWGTACDIVLRGDYAYIADGGQGMAIINISDPINPSTPIQTATPGYADGICVSGDYAYIADGFAGLTIINISDPENPGTPHFRDTIGWGRDVFVSGDYAYIADAYNGLAIINISNPENPGMPIYENTDGDAFGVYVRGEYAYLADWNSGLAVINISDPTNPGTPIYENTTGNAYGIYLSGDNAYLADDTSGLAVINVSDPLNLGTPIYEDTNGEARGVFVRGEYAYVADYESGLAVIEIADLDDPIVLNIPSDFTVEAGYTEQSLSWTATDANPDFYTIELIGTGIVVLSTPWVDNIPVVYNIPDGLGVGSYIFTINFTDDYRNFIADSVIFTVEDTTDPVITVSPANITVEVGYNGQSIAWTATDLNPYNYTIELQGTGMIAGPTSWTSGIAINFNISEGLDLGSHIFTVNFTDNSGNFIADSINFTVIEDTTNPFITVIPNNITVEYGYSGQSISWSATDLNPYNYTIELQGIGFVAGPTTWISGIAINYEIPEGYDVGSYAFTVNFTDDYGNFNITNFGFTVEDTTYPVITDNPNNFVVEYEYTDQSLSWTATDANPGTYTVELIGTGIVVPSTPWTNNTPVVYNIPDGLISGAYTYEITFTDDYGNSITSSVTFTVNEPVEPPSGEISFGNYFLVFMGLGVVCLVLIKIQKLTHKSN